MSMFAMIPMEVLRDPDLSHAEKIAVAVVAARMEYRTRVAKASNTQLGHDMGFRGDGAANSFRRAIQPAVKKGYVEHKPGNGRTISYYRVIYDQPIKPDAPGSAESAEGGLPNSQTLPLPFSQTISESLSRVSSREEKSEGLQALTVEEEFETLFWPPYPRKEAKIAALKAFRKARDSVSCETIVEGLKRHRFSDDPKYIPLAASWLNAGRWADEQPPPEDALPEFPGWEEWQVAHIYSSGNVEPDRRGTECLRGWVTQGFRYEVLQHLIERCYHHEQVRQPKSLADYHGQVQENAHLAVRRPATASPQPGRTGGSSGDPARPAGSGR